MMNVVPGPISLEIARKHRYGTWSGDRKGKVYREGYCIAEVYPRTSIIPVQCSKRIAHKISDHFCTQHWKIAARFNQQ